MAYASPSITTSGLTFAQLQAGGLTSVLEGVITASKAATLAPSAAPTLAASGSGATLPAATYWVVVTETDGIGETTVSATSASQAVTLGQNLVITPSTLRTGNTARNFYVGTGSTGPFMLAGTGSSASTFTISAPLPSNSYAVTPPTVNSTGYTYVDAAGVTINGPLQFARAAEKGNLQTVYQDVAWTIDTFLRGDPMSFPAVISKLRRAQTAIASINQALTDIGTLIDANAGTLKPATTGIGNSTVARTWP